MAFQHVWQHKLLQPDTLESDVTRLRAEGRTIATLNGSFDLLHAGHLHIIHEASTVADCLIVALNSDDSIRRYKSADRPIISLQYRLMLMAALEYVDYVTWFEEDDPCHLLSKIRPDIHVNGSEYGYACVEASTVQSYGGRIHIVDLVAGLSTSNIVEKIIALAAVGR
jgi:rfaE bifunctional protein nucleotidyltransferase chain/domain